MSDLRGLLERVQAGAKPDRELDGDIWKAFGGTFDLFGPRWIYADGVIATERWTFLTASVDAALALAEPGQDWVILNTALREISDKHNRLVSDISAKEFPRAILAALLRAKIAVSA